MSHIHFWPVWGRLLRFQICVGNGTSKYKILNFWTTEKNHNLDRYIAFLGIPNKVRTDLGKQFTSKMFQELTEQLQIHHEFTAKDFHSGNHAERAFKILGKLLRTLNNKEKRHWSNFLPKLQQAYNARYHRPLVLSPFALGCLPRSSTQFNRVNLSDHSRTFSKNC